MAGLSVKGGMGTLNITINGPKIMFRIPIFGGIEVTETVVWSWMIIAFIFILCLVLTRKLEKIPRSYSQKLAEKIVVAIDNMVESTMGKRNTAYAPYILTLMTFSILGSLIGLLGFRSVTADINTTLAWALMTFVLIYYSGIRFQGLKHFKGFIEPTPVMLPLNIISEMATPVSLSFRHFGNILSGMIITLLMYGGLAAASSAIIPNSIPFLQLGLPAVFSVYFDLFSGCIQAYVFSMLTMVYVSNANDPS